MVPDHWEFMNIGMLLTILESEHTTLKWSANNSCPCSEKLPDNKMWAIVSHQDSMKEQGAPEREPAVFAVRWVQATEQKKERQNDSHGERAHFLKSPIKLIFSEVPASKLQEVRSRRELRRQEVQHLYAMHWCYSCYWDDHFWWRWNRLKPVETTGHPRGGDQVAGCTQWLWSLCQIGSPGGQELCWRWSQLDDYSSIFSYCLIVTFCYFDKHILGSILGSILCHQMPAAFRWFYSVAESGSWRTTWLSRLLSSLPHRSTHMLILLNDWRWWQCKSSMVLSLAVVGVRICRESKYVMWLPYSS